MYQFGRLLKEIVLHEMAVK